MDQTFILSKLRVPAVRAEIVPRSRLLRLLDSGLPGRMILLSAPAGYGKTTLLADWAARLPEAGRVVAWISLEQADSDPTRFIGYVAEALRPVVPVVAETMAGALRSAVATPPMLLPLLVNALAVACAEGARAVLVLDDYHTLQSKEIHEAVTFLLEHLPAYFSLVIASREDPPLPLARLRARAEMCELRAADLRFSDEEAAQFLNDTMRLGLSPSEIAALERRTEGWVAGLQLAALSMRDQSDVAGFISSFTGSHRFVLDYLLEEVLHRQAAEIQTFLQHTCIADRLCASLCDALLAAGAEPDRQEITGASQRILEQLERANLFLVPLDSGRAWYRYHQLFADLLKARLQASAPELLPRLHAAAAGWYERQELLAEAIEHRLAAGELGAAARLISRAVAMLVQRPQHLSAMLRWVKALPEEMIRADTRLSLDYAWILAATGRIKEAEQQALLVEQHLAGEQSRAAAATEDPGMAQPEEVRGELAALQTLLAARNNDTARVVSVARKALDLLPSTRPARRAGVMIFLAGAYVQSGRLDEARAAYAEAEELSVVAGDTFSTLLSMQSAAGLHLLAGRLGLAAAVLRRALRLEGLAIPALLGIPHVGLGQVLAERGEFAEAKEHLIRGTQLLQTLPDWNTNLAQGYATLLRIHCVQGQREEAVATLRTAQAWATGVTGGKKTAASMAVQFWLHTGDLVQTARWLEDTEHPDRLGNSSPLDYQAEVVLRARAWLTLGRPEQALQELQRVGAGSRAAGHKGRMVEIAAIQALALHRMGRRAEALSKLSEALTAGEVEGYVLPFLEQGAELQALLQESIRRGVNQTYAATLLSHFERAGQGAGLSAEPRPGQPSAVREPLSERELEVLGLLVAGLSGPEIAGSLMIGLNTVKTHLKSIYGKLGVHNREQAIIRARELCLV